MPYSKAHKALTRDKILESAYRLFSHHGFAAITVDKVMQTAALTRGAFYNHFKSKADLYSAAIAYGAQSSPALDNKPSGLSDREWVEILLENYLSVEHVGGTRACPLAFMATDIAVRGETAKACYARAFTGMNDILYQRLQAFRNVPRSQVEAATAMMIGAVAIARTMEREAAANLLNTCRQQIVLMLL